MSDNKDIYKVTCPCCEAVLQLGEVNKEIVVSSYEKGQEKPDLSENEADNKNSSDNPKPSLLRTLIEGNDKEGYIDVGKKSDE